MFAKAVSMVSATVVALVAPPPKSEPTAKHSKNTVKQTRDEKVTAKPKHAAEYFKTKKIQKPWMIGVQQHCVVILNYTKLL